MSDIQSSKANINKPTSNVVTSKLRRMSSKVQENEQFLFAGLQQRRSNAKITVG